MKITTVRRILLAAGTCLVLGLALPAAAEGGRNAGRDTGTLGDYWQNKHEAIDGPGKGRHEGWRNMTPEQRQQKKEAFEKMTPEQRQQKMEERHKKQQTRIDEMKQKIDTLPPEEKAKAQERLDGMQQRMEKREAIRKELESLPPEQREAKMKEMKEQFQKERQEHQAERKAKFDERWNKSSPEEKAKFCSNAKERCASGNGGPLCEAATTACSQ